MRLEGKVALISGGARGMGAAEAKLFAQEGAKVAIGDILDDEGRKTEAEINESGGDCIFVHLDVTNESDWKDAVSAAVSQFGKLDILVNNAGVLLRGKLEETSSQDWDFVMGVNAKGTFPNAWVRSLLASPSGSDWITPVSLLASIRQTKIVDGFMASSNAFKSIFP